LLQEAQFILINRYYNQGQDFKFIQLA